jgi:TonB family protein
MKKLYFAFSLLPVMLVFFTASSAIAQTTPDNDEKPAVLKAVTPKTYPGIARSARASGKVVVRVTINSKGEVSATKLISGHPLLQSASRQAAMRWLFAAGEKKEEERFAELEFIYTDTAKEEDAEIYFNPPYRVVIMAAPAQLNF